jgi:hypothetical protein
VRCENSVSSRPSMAHRPSEHTVSFLEVAGSLLLFFMALLIVVLGLTWGPAA